MKKDIVILGSSGFAKEVLWLIEDNNQDVAEWNVLGFIDSQKSGEAVAGYPILGNDTWLMNYPNKIYVACGFGSPSLREKVVGSYRQARCNVVFPNIISRRALFSSRVSFGEGVIICAGTILTTDIRIGNFVVLNLCCTVGHDTIIEDFTTVNPGSNISGNVSIHKSCEIGTGVAIIQGRNIGPYTTVGAGSVIIRDVPGHCTVVGNPGRILEK